MSQAWRKLDVDAALMLMPREYRDAWVRVACRDCGQESDTQLHVLGLKCRAPRRAGGACSPPRLSSASRLPTTRPSNTAMMEPGPQEAQRVGGVAPLAMVAVKAA